MQLLNVSYSSVLRPFIGSRARSWRAKSRQEEEAEDTRDGTETGPAVAKTKAQESNKDPETSVTSTIPSLLRSFVGSRASSRRAESRQKKAEDTRDGTGAGPAAAKTKAQEESNENPETSATTDGDETQETSLTTGQIMDLLKDLWSDDKSAIVRALTEIADIGLRNASPEVKIRVLGGHTAVFQVVQKYVGCLEIQKEGMRALGNFCRLKPTKTNLGEIGCVEVILASMEQYPDSECVQRHGCLVIGNLVRGIKDNAERVEQSGGISVIIAAMKARPNSEKLQSLGCWALLHTSEWEEYRPLIVKAGGASAIGSVMEKYWDHPELRELAYNAMGRLIKTPICPCRTTLLVNSCSKHGNF